MEILYLITGILFFCANILLYGKLFSELNTRFELRIKRLERKVGLEEFNNGYSKFN